MAKYPSLATSAYIVIAILGIKLVLSGGLHYAPKGWDFAHYLEVILEDHIFDLAFSALMMLIFFVPLFLKPKNNNDHHMFI